MPADRTPIELPEHNHDDAVMLVGPDEKIEPKPRPRGPTVGSGRYADADRELFPAIKKLVDAGISLYGAISQIADRISGTGNTQTESLIRRVERRYKKRAANGRIKGVDVS